MSKRVSKMSKKIVVKCSCKKEYTLEEFRKLPFVNYGITDFSTVETFLK